MNEVTIRRHKDGSLAIEQAPEIFLCTRESLQSIIDGNNQAVARKNDARSEIQRLEAELAKASRLQQSLTIASQTIQDLTTQLDKRKKDYDHERELHWQTLQAYRTHHEEAERITKENETLRRLNIEATQLASRYAAALHKIADADYRGNRSTEATIADNALNTKP